MPKTYEELLASGSHTEIMAVVASNTKRIDTLFAEANKRADKANTADELTEITKLDAETEALQVKAIELKKIEDVRTKNAKRHADLNEPDYRLPFPNGGDPTKSERKTSLAQFSIGALKHITFGSRQENEETAFRFFHWWAASSFGNAKSVQFCKDNGIEVTPGAGRAIKAAAAGMNENVNEQGGALVPPEFDATLIRLIETYGKFRQFTMMTSMGSDTKSQPRRTGGVTAYWVGEATQITRSRPAYDNVSLVAKKLAALCAMSSEISEDSAISTADQLAFEIAYAFALSEDQAGFLGDGSATYGGITGVCPKLKGLSGTIANIAGLVVATGTGYATTYGATVLADFNAVLGLLPEYADTDNAGWFAHKSYYHTVMQRLELAAGGVTANEISKGDRRPRPLFLGYPVNFCQVMPRTPAVSQVCALLGDLSLATTMGDRRTRTMFTDPYSLSEFDQVQVRGTERVDINTHDVGNADATAANRVPGPVVGLITASS